MRTTPRGRYTYDGRGKEGWRKPAYLLSPAGVQQQSYKSGGAGARAVISEQGVLQFVFANDVLGELDVKFIFRTENLNVLCDIWRKIFNRPRPQYRMFILRGTSNVRVKTKQITTTSTLPTASINYNK